MTPVKILNGGDHSEDYDRWRISSNNVPRERMLQIIREKDLRRPVSNINK